MSVLRIRALQVLADMVQACVPELSGRVCGGAAEAPHQLQFPSLSIDAVRFRYFPDQAAEVKGLGASRALFNVGRVEGLVQLRLGAATAQQRYELEQRILEEIFWADLERPGVAVATIPDCHDAVVAFELDENTWEDEKAFDKKWYSVTTALVQLPALVAKGNVFTVEEVRLALSADFSTPVTSPASVPTETTSVDEDGVVTIVP